MQKKKKTFEVYGLKQFVDVCVAVNYFINDKRDISKLKCF